MEETSFEKYSATIVGWLKDLGYTHCFFVPGGNSMHLLDGARSKMKCVSFVHEMSATIAAEYFNESSKLEKAWVLLTAGPGLTHAVSGIAGAFLEGRELLVLGGQVKSSDLATGDIRQRGIQEIDGVSIVKTISKTAKRLEKPVDETTFKSLVESQYDGKPGPVFIEVCLDVQGANVELKADRSNETKEIRNRRFHDVRTAAATISELIQTSRRPVILIGGGVRRNEAGLIPKLIELGIPVMTTYNGADRVGSEFPLYFGRPNTWGMRYSNIVAGQADLIVSFGSRLGLQQTGFNWESFAPKAKIVQVEIDKSEIEKGHPKIHQGFNVDATDCLMGIELSRERLKIDEWLNFSSLVKRYLPLSEEVNSSHEGFWNPYDFMIELSKLSTNEDVVIPCSSGGSFTSFYQSFENKQGQIIISNKSLASMGYGLAGAIGASIANIDKKTILVEGDGGFAQNLQELATISVIRPKIKIFLMCNEGYASIRMTQRNYFDGAYLGCDTKSGLGFPSWQKLAEAYEIGSTNLSHEQLTSADFEHNFNSDDPHIFFIRVHPEQTFYPKISSRINENGGMESEPLWAISPQLPPQLSEIVFKYLKKELISDEQA
jgi:acetolactate synthase-1/2/3 large subunit